MVLESSISGEVFGRPLPIEKKQQEENIFYKRTDSGRISFPIYFGKRFTKKKPGRDLTDVFGKWITVGAPIREPDIIGVYVYPRNRGTAVKEAVNKTVEKFVGIFK